MLTCGQCRSFARSFVSSYNVVVSVPDSFHCAIVLSPFCTIKITVTMSPFLKSCIAAPLHHSPPVQHKKKVFKAEKVIYLQKPGTRKDICEINIWKEKSRWPANTGIGIHCRLIYINILLECSSTNTMKTNCIFISAIQHSVFIWQMYIFVSYYTKYRQYQEKKGLTSRGQH